ncbi:glutathione S-transferase family protein [Rhizorhabdus wittichii]|uniref:glutathione S-transferase family protein n=1 Tax=Rhizorhabdus wittichii TaxID=160791 RepID=UPI0002DBB11C|nr:glutathione S-transferase N-terminal domain-containing protein [Rhizorhabdus wittichii]
MIDLYTTPSPNTWKASIMLEECGLPYRILPVDIGKGEQFDPAFLAISPNGKVPAIVDHDGAGGPVAIFESGAILVHLAEKTGRFLPASGAARSDVLAWLFWQVGGLGPSSGQAHHFLGAEGPGAALGASRFVRETERLYGVLDRRLADRDWIAGDYSIADIACWGWVWFNGRLVERFANLVRWFVAMSARPAVSRGREAGFAHIPEAQRERLKGCWWSAAALHEATA